MTESVDFQTPWITNDRLQTFLKYYATVEHFSVVPSIKHGLRVDEDLKTLIAHAFKPTSDFLKLWCGIILGDIEHYVSTKPDFPLNLKIVYQLIKHWVGVMKLNTLEQKILLHKLSPYYATSKPPPLDSVPDRLRALIPVTAERILRGDPNPLRDMERYVQTQETPERFLHQVIETYAPYERVLIVQRSLLNLIVFTPQTTPAAVVNHFNTALNKSKLYTYHGLIRAAEGSSYPYTKMLCYWILLFRMWVGQTQLELGLLPKVCWFFKPIGDQTEPLYRFLTVFQAPFAANKELVGALRSKAPRNTFYVGPAPPNFELNSFPAVYPVY